MSDVGVVRAALLLSGDELLRGFISDANGAWIARQLRERSISLTTLRIVGDSFDDLVATLEAMRVAGNDLIITSGGLGPTHDDRTSEAVAHVSGHSLTVDTAALAIVESRVRAHGRMKTPEDAARFAAGNSKQATFPKDAEVLEPMGTAPGYVLQADAATFMVLPGPPAELRYAVERAWDTSALQSLLERVRPLHERHIRLWGVPESLVGKVLEDTAHVDSDAARVTVCARDGEIEVSIRGFNVVQVDEVVTSIANVFPDEIFALDDERTLEQLVGPLLQQTGNRRVAVAESCTGGMLGERFTAVGGSSGWFLGGVISYANSIKRDVLGVPDDVLTNDGAVSETAARSMASGVRRVTGAEIGISITGIAGPAGAAAGKPVGTVHICIDDGAVVVHRHRVFPGDRGSIRRRACTTALHMLRELLSAQLGTH